MPSLRWLRMTPLPKPELSYEDKQYYRYKSRAKSLFELACCEHGGRCRRNTLKRDIEQAAPLGRIGQ